MKSRSEGEATATPPPPDGDGILAAVPAHQRGRILAGIRWSFWLSVLGAPFGYGTSTLLARTGPDVIGTYGLLMVWVALVSTIFYLGGDAAVVKYVPEIDSCRRPDFLASYFTVIILGLLPWLAAAALWPQALHYLFGSQDGSRFQFILLCLAPIYIAYSMVVAALKGMLDMAWAQSIFRFVTVGTFVFYALVYFFYRGFLNAYYREVVWGVYLVLIATAAAVGFRQLRTLEGWRLCGRRLRFFLPPGFWRYVLTLQESSALAFLTARLDFLLVLNFAGLATLGKYVALLTVAQIVTVVNKSFIDALLPSLTNVLARRNYTAASQIFAVNLRILFAVNMMLMCGLMFFIHPIALLMGPTYVSLSRQFVVMILFFGLAAPGAIGSTALTSVGRQQRTVWVNLGQIALFSMLFMALWPKWHLGGAIFAQGAAVLVSSTVLLAVARFGVPFKIRVLYDYVLFVAVGAPAGVFALTYRPLSLPTALLAWVISVFAFLLLSGFRFAEVRSLVEVFVRSGRAQL
ncbi:MAG: lipopolysaccharide biosynthesis protein [Terriglobales bacterium]